MKKANQLKFLICTLALASTQAKVVFSGMGSSGTRSTNQSMAGTVTVSSSSQSTTIECRRGDAVSYGFMKTLLLGDTPSYTIANGKILVNLPTRVSACIKDISAEAISNPIDNNVYLKFNVKIDSSQYPAGTQSIEKEYEKCMAHLSGGDSSFYTVEKLREKGHLAPPVTLDTDLPDIDGNRNSELVIASTNKDFDYKNDMPFGLANVAQHTSFSDSSFNCMDYVKPADHKVMANKTNEYELREEAIAACNGKNLTDIAESLKNLRSDSGGNYDDLTRILSGIQHQLIDEEVNQMVARMEQIESDISPSVEDVKEGDKFGVSKEARKKLLQEYASHMNKFSKELLPAMKAELEHLMKEYADLGDSEADERRKDQINESIEKINDVIAKFNRQNENGAEYKKVVEALREGNMQTSGRKILSGIILAQEFSHVKLEGTNKRNVEEAENNSERSITRLKQGTLADWGDEALIRAGDNSPIRRRQQILKGIQQRASKDRKNYMMKLNAYDDYIQQYAEDLASSYCTTGGSYEDCMTVRSTYLPYIYNQYSSWKQNSYQDYNQSYNAKYGAAYNEQKSILSRFNGLYSNYKLNAMQNQLAGATASSPFDLWTGADTSYSSGIPGLNFDLSGAGNANFNNSGWNNNFNLMQPQQRTPSSSTWSNPYR